MLIEPLIKTAKDRPEEQEKLKNCLHLVKSILVNVNGQVRTKLWERICNRPFHSLFSSFLSTLHGYVIVLSVITHGYLVTEPNKYWCSLASLLKAWRKPYERNLIMVVIIVRLPKRSELRGWLKSTIVWMPRAQYRWIFLWADSADSFTREFFFQPRQSFF